MGHRVLFDLINPIDGQCRRLRAAVGVFGFAAPHATPNGAPPRTAVSAARRAAHRPPAPRAPPAQWRRRRDRSDREHRMEPVAGALDGMTTVRLDCLREQLVVAGERCSHRLGLRLPQARGARNIG